MLYLRYGSATMVPYPKMRARGAKINGKCVWKCVSSLLVTMIATCVAMLLPADAKALSFERVGNFSEPTYVTSDPSDPDRLFVVELSGQIKLVENGQTSLFLDIESAVLSPPDEDASLDHALYSMAFSPEFATDSLFYVLYSSADDPGTANEDESGEWHLAEFTANGDSAIPASRREVLTIEYPPNPIHYGGQLHFGPDDYLYASTGDGGPQRDPDGNSQNLSNLLGNVLRIDPQPELGREYRIPSDNPFAGPTPGEDEIWSYGLRNPWRFSFDRQTGDLVIGDVGYQTWEEVNFAVAPDAGKGANFGWNCREGTHLFSAAPPCEVPQAFTDPVFEYEHAAGNCSVTGGYVVRDPALGDLFGRYLYADFCVGELRSLSLGPQVLDRSEDLCVQFPTSFGEDSLGRIYVTSRRGPVYRLVPEGSSGSCDTTAPDTQVDSGPTGTIATDQATFTFSGTPASDTTKIQCRIDSEPFADCSSPKTFTGFTDGPHTATFRAEDAAGNQDQSPAASTFTVDTTPPGTQIDSGPSGPTGDATPSFEFSSEPGATFECRVDTDAFSSCSSPETVAALPDGPHTLEVRATDLVGNTDPTPATRSFTLDTTPPDTQIDSGPTGTITTDQASFTFSGTPASDTARVQCRIDSEPFADCTSPKAFTGLSDGPHTLEVRATDSVGNTDPTPATRSFTVDTIVSRAKISKVKVSGPNKVKKGKKATYKVKVTNSGDATATGVRLKVKGRGVSFNTSVGKIGPKKTRTVNVKLKPKKPGKVKATFKVTSKNAGGKTVKKKITVRK